MMHLMLLDAREHIEARAAGRSSTGRRGYALAEEVIGQRFYCLGILLAALFERAMISALVRGLAASAMVSLLNFM